MKTSLILLAASLSLTSAWVAPPSQRMSRAAAFVAPKMALDYNDPIVGEEYNNVQILTFEECEEELLQSGINVPPTMNEMEVKLMLVEVRLQLNGKLKGDKPKEKPTSFSSPFEEAMWTKPLFAEYYESLKEKGDTNAMNVVSELLNDPEGAQQRYGKDYRGVIRKANEALTAPPPVNSPKIKFAGFPANMGEAGCKMTLEALGAIADFECEETDDSMSLTGVVTFEDIETAKACVAQYAGMDMGMGNLLEMESV